MVSALVPPSDLLIRLGDNDICRLFWVSLSGNQRMDWEILNEVNMSTVGLVCNEDLCRNACYAIEVFGVLTLE